MKTRILILLVSVLTLSIVFADTYLYRVPINAKTKQQFTQEGEAVGTKDERQPFYGTYLLESDSTNYYLLKVTPQNGKDPNLPYDLYQLQYIDGEEGFILNKIDNSDIFPLKITPPVVSKSS